MLKVYEGLVCFEDKSVRYSIDWSCPTCSSPDVQIDPDDTRQVYWCDGGPSTEDRLRFWICRSCGHRTEGQNMRGRVFDFVVLYDYNRPRTYEIPEGFLDSFAAFVRQNVDAIAALRVAVHHPRDLTRSQLRDLRLELERHGFFEGKLRQAWSEAGKQDIAASIVGYVRQAVLGGPLVPHEDRVRAAMGRILASREWSEPQKRWLRRIGDRVRQETVVDREALDTGQFKADGGGFNRLNKKVFDGQLEAVLADVNEELWKEAA